MPSLASWERGRRSYIAVMEERLDVNSTSYGFEIVKHLYGVTHRLETVLDDPDGIDPAAVDHVLGNLEDQYNQLREWQIMKERQYREKNATIADRT